MNYRHAYHAGNFADIFKHAILMLLIERLRAKDKPFSVIDTHAGIGIYDLAGEAAQKTLEYQGGIMRLMEASAPSPALSRFRDLVAGIIGLEPGQEIHRYPGSPRIARSLLREGDRLQLVELQPEDVETLRVGFARDRQTIVHAMDAYTALKALLPPTPRRGLVLIDPPFEKTDEFDRLVDGLHEAHPRWAPGVYAIWDPLKARAPGARFHPRLAAAAGVAAAQVLVDRGELARVGHRARDLRQRLGERLAHLAVRRAHLRLRQAHLLALRQCALHGGVQRQPQRVRGRLRPRGGGRERGGQRECDVSHHASCREASPSMTNDRRVSSSC